MKKNLKSCVETVTLGNAQILVDMNRYDMIEHARMTPDLVHKKSAHMTAAWHFSKASRVCIALSGVDLSEQQYLTFSAFAVQGAGGSFSLMLDYSERGDGKNGYEITLPITRDGWNDYRVELPFLRSVGDASGWECIGSLCLDCVAGGQANRAETVLYFDHFFVWDGPAAPLYTTMPELKGAAVFSTGGGFSIVDRKRIANSPESAPARPFERDGVLWLPMAPVAAGIAHTAVADTRAFTLSFTYRRKKYVFSANADYMTVNGEREAIGFYPAVVGGTLFFPADFVRSFFHWRQCFVDPMGLVVLSNRKNVLDSRRDEGLIWQLIADTTFVRPSAEQILADLRRRFPNATRGRLLASFEELMQLRRDAKQDAALAGYVNLLKEQYGTKSERFAADPLGEGDGADALTDAADAIIAFSMLYRVTGDKQYGERAAHECEALVALSAWSAHGAEVLGRLTLAVSLCYDWCHHVWSEARKATVERGVLRNAMRVGLDIYLGKGKMWRAGSVTCAVANAGMLAASLTFSDIYPQTSYRLLDRILRNAEPCMASYAPDGGNAESLRAWEKTTWAMTLFVAMLEKACGSDYGFATAPGFADTMYFAVHAETANGAWNYHDCEAFSVDTAMAFRFARTQNDGVIAWIRRQALLSGRKPISPFDILFYVPVDDTMTPHLPLDAVYRRAGLAMMRDGWNADSTVVGLHGGKNHELRGDLDAGGVMLEMGGVRFFSETGGEESLPILLRRRAVGQNTITVDPAQEPAPDQNPDAIVPLTEMRSADARAYAIVDMTSVSDRILRGKRGVMLTENRRVAVIQDELTLDAPADVVFGVWTKAEISLLGTRRAVLTQNGVRMACRLCGVGAPARFAIETVEGSEMRRLVVRVSGKDKLRMAVVCRLLDAEESVGDMQYEMVPMSKWGEI